MISVAVAGSGGLVHSQQWRAPRRASRHLAPAVDAAVDFLGISPGKLGGVAVVRGPGSFTGLRMTMAYGLGLARSSGLPMAGIDYLPLIARGPAPLISGTLAVIVHSRMREIYFQAFSCPEARQLTPPSPLKIDSLPEILSGLAAPLHLVGSGIRRNRDFFSRELPNLSILSDAWDEPSAEILCRAAIEAEFRKDPPEPVYMRPSDAEENLDRIAALRGLDPKEAERRLRAATHKSSKS